MAYTIEYQGGGLLEITIITSTGKKELILTASYTDV
jgi:hypothetical protein